MRLFFSLLLFFPGLFALRAEQASVPAHALSVRSPNVAPEYAAFDNLTLCEGKNGFMEWTVHVQGGLYSVHFYYCSGEQRPCQLSINGKDHPDKVLNKSTGGFFTPDLRWQTYGPL